MLDVLVAHARTNPTVVVFDELSSITRVDGAAGLLRTKIQPHYQHIGLLFAGSEPSTMRMLFTGADQPLYAQADLVDIAPLTLAAVVELIDNGFASMPPAGLAGRIHAFTGGHPQRSMQLADAAWFAVGDGIDAVAVWETALERCRAATADSHETRFSGMSPADQAVMRLAASDGVLFGRDAELLSLSRSSAQHARHHLIEQGQIATDAGRVVVVDPLYADWIKHRFTI